MKVKNVISKPEIIRTTYDKANKNLQKKTRVIKKKQSRNTEIVPQHKPSPIPPPPPLPPPPSYARHRKKNSLT